MLYECNYVEIGDINLLHASLQSLVISGYEFPILIKKTSSDVLRADSKEDTQSSTYDNQLILNGKKSPVNIVANGGVTSK